MIQSGVFGVMRQTAAASPLRQSASTKRRTSWRLSGSSPCSGSSRISRVGCLTRARTISASRCCPRRGYGTAHRRCVCRYPEYPASSAPAYAACQIRPDRCRLSRSSRKNHVTHVGADAVFKVQAAADVANMLLISQMVSPCRGGGQTGSGRCCIPEDGRR